MAASGRSEPLLQVPGGHPKGRALRAAILACASPARAAGGLQEIVIGVGAAPTGLALVQAGALALAGPPIKAAGVGRLCDRARRPRGDRQVNFSERNSRRAG